MASSSSSTAAASSVVLLRLYRNLLRVAKPFTAPSPNARVLNCLLSRTGIDDHIVDWHAYTSTPSSTNNDVHRSKARDLSVTYYREGRGWSLTKEAGIPPQQTPQRLFRRLLREVVCGGDQNGIIKSTWPSLVDTTILHNVIRREFRNGPECQSLHFDSTIRRQVAFMALRELGKKLSYFDRLENSSAMPLPQQAAWQVSPLPFAPSSSYLRPGAFLLAHPSLNDSYFSKTVICILEHIDDDDVVGLNEHPESASKRRTNVQGQTYGIIINRISLNPATGKNRTLREAFEQHMLPGKLAEVFGDSIVREGGPVHVSLQMLHLFPQSADDSVADKSLGGRVIPMIPESDETSTAIYSDNATYFQGEVFKAMAEVENGRLDRDDVAFFVGASTWSSGQLRNEIAQGFWIPCRGPPDMARTGICEHDPTKTHAGSKSNGRPRADLWLSMMSACGEDEAKLAHLFFREEGRDECGLACDAFDDDDTV